MKMANLLKGLIGAVLGYAVSRLLSGRVGIPTVDKFIAKIGGLKTLENVYAEVQILTQGTDEQKRAKAVEIIKGIAKKNGFDVSDYAVNLAIEFVIAKIKERQKR